MCVKQLTLPGWKWVLFDEMMSDCNTNSLDLRLLITSLCCLSVLDLQFLITPLCCLSVLDLQFLITPLYCLSLFYLRLLITPLCCLSFYLRLLITPLVFSNFSYSKILIYKCILYITCDNKVELQWICITIWHHFIK
jgi:hypothetical protein